MGLSRYELLPEHSDLWGLLPFTGCALVQNWSRMCTNQSGHVEKFRYLNWRKSMQGGYTEAWKEAWKGSPLLRTSHNSWRKSGRKWGWHSDEPWGRSSSCRTMGSNKLFLFGFNHYSDLQSHNIPGLVFSYQKWKVSIQEIALSCEITCMPPSSFIFLWHPNQCIPRHKTLGF